MEEEKSNEEKDGEEILSIDATMSFLCDLSPFKITTINPSTCLKFAFYNSCVF